MREDLALEPPVREDAPVKIVVPFPIIDERGDQLVVPPREYGTLIESPEPRFLLAV